MNSYRVHFTKPFYQVVDVYSASAEEAAGDALIQMPDPRPTNETDFEFEVEEIN
jgi:hypothetical protein